MSIYFSGGPLGRGSGVEVFSLVGLLWANAGDGQLSVHVDLLRSDKQMFLILSRKTSNWEYPSSSDWFHSFGVQVWFLNRGKGPDV